MIEEILKGMGYCFFKVWGDRLSWPFLDMVGLMTEAWEEAKVGCSITFVLAEASLSLLFLHS